MTGHFVEDATIIGALPCAAFWQVMPTVVMVASKWRGFTAVRVYLKLQAKLGSEFRLDAR